MDMNGKAIYHGVDVDPCLRGCDTQCKLAIHVCGICSICDYLQIHIHSMQRCKHEASISPTTANPQANTASATPLSAVFSMQDPSLKAVFELGICVVKKRVLSGCFRCHP